jgi:hypothetical protein
VDICTFKPECLCIDCQFGHTGSSSAHSDGISTLVSIPKLVCYSVQVRQYDVSVYNNIRFRLQYITFQMFSFVAV